MRLIMASYSSIIFSLLQVCHLYSCKDLNKSDVRTIVLHQYVPIVNADGTLLNYNDSYKVSYYKNICIYSLTYSFDSSASGHNIISNEKRDYFFIHHKDSLYGYRFDANPLPFYKTERLLKDSILKEISFFTTGYDSLLAIKPDSSYYDKSGDLVKMFRRKTLSDQSENYRLSFYYSDKLKNIPEHLSNLDNEIGSKLYKISIFYAGGYIKKYKLNMPQREMYTQMAEMEVVDRTKIISLANLYLNNMK